MDRRSREARKAFNAFFKKEKNFMTPHVLEYLKVKNFYAELARGEGIRSEIIYGVTILENAEEGLKHRTDLSAIFYSKDKAFKYLRKLEKEGK